MAREEPFPEKGTVRYGFGNSAKWFITQKETLLKIVRHGENLGFDFLTVSDHIIIPRNISPHYPYTVGGDFPSASTGDYLEQITLLAFITGITHRLRLVPSIMVISHRSPVLTAKMLATLDVLSGGRVILGAETGWMEEKFKALELPPFN
jgi:alkanesulfonate monooxygenase SsuD/methylene tetrahydromethanopterin reductase-like flavin-dependent oxidoreductase (luciferase family)